MTQSPCLPELPKLPRLGCDMDGRESSGYDARDMRDFATAHGLACYEAGSAAAAQAVPEGYKLISGHAYGQNYVSLVEPSGKILVNAYEQGFPQMFAFLTALAAPTQGAEGAAPQDVVGEASDARIAGALFDFLGFLTTSEEQWKFSAYDDASPAVLALEQWAAKRGFALEPCDVSGWRAALTPSPTPTAPQDADALRAFKSELGKRVRAALAQHQPQQGEGA